MFHDRLSQNASKIVMCAIVIVAAVTFGIVWRDASKSRAAVDRLVVALGQTGAAKEMVNTYYPITRSKRIQSELDIYLNPERASERTEKWYISLTSGNAIQAEIISAAISKLQSSYGEAKIKPAISNNEAILAAASGVKPQVMRELCQTAFRQDEKASCGFVADTPPNEKLKAELSGLVAKRVISWERPK